MNFVKFLRTPFFTEHPWATASILREGRMFLKKNALALFIFYLLCSSFFFSGFNFYKEALCFIIFILSLCSNMLNLENILEYICQKFKKNMLILKFHPRMKCLHVFFSFFHPRMKSHLSFIPG